MNIIVAVPGSDHVATAGVRIRYERLASRLATLGHDLRVVLIDELRPSDADPRDIYLFSKCYDARGVLAAAGLRARGCQVGADFFDDYYSHGNDSRFVHLRNWLRRIGEFLTFGLCSTAAMRTVAQEYLPNLPYHVMNDSYDLFDAAVAGNSIIERLERVQHTGVMEIGWFGIGDNPYFDVGLSDLRRFGGMLGECASTGLSPQLSILTNRRSMTVERLEVVARLPIAWRMEEWSEAREAALLASSFACFLPVNAQRFSTAKSLNRAVTALTAGVQVLSAGYPLYDAFDPLIYRNAADLVADIRSSAMRLRPETMPLLARLLARHASPEAEASRLAAFLLALPEATPRDAPMFAVIHGRHSSFAVHKFTQRNGHLSVAGPKPVNDINYDLRILPGAKGRLPVAQLSSLAMKHLGQELGQQTHVFKGPGGKDWRALPLDGDEALNLVRDTSPPSEFDSVILNRYADDLEAMSVLVRRLFAGATPLVSEQVSPFSAPATVEVRA